MDSATLANAHALARVLTGEGATEAALEFAHAQLELERIKTTREDLLATLDPGNPEIRTMRQIFSMGRYERYAFTRRRKALRNL